MISKFCTYIVLTLKNSPFNLTKKVIEFSWNLGKYWLVLLIPRVSLSGTGQYSPEAISHQSKYSTEQILSPSFVFSFRVEDYLRAELWIKWNLDKCPLTCVNSILAASFVHILHAGNMNMFYYVLLRIVHRCSKLKHSVCMLH